MFVKDTFDTPDQIGVTQRRRWPRASRERQNRVTWYRVRAENRPEDVGMPQNRGRVLTAIAPEPQPFFSKGIKVGVEPDPFQILLGL